LNLRPLRNPYFVILNGAQRSEESGFLAARISNLLEIIDTAGKSLPAKKEILRSLRSLRMTRGEFFAEVSTRNFSAAQS
jgi:hypothetical protein